MKTKIRMDTEVALWTSADKVNAQTLPDVRTYAERHYGLAGAHALAAETGKTPMEITSSDAARRGVLIAAAPALVEALRGLLDEFESRTALIESCDLDPSEVEACDKARAALALVEGGGK